MTIEIETELLRVKFVPVEISVSLTSSFSIKEWKLSYIDDIHNIENIGKTIQRDYKETTNIHQMKYFYGII
jgi:hypothetical protein